MSPVAGCWYFLHIPKTAGTTFRVFLENQFHLHQICPAYEFFELKKYTDEQLSQMRLFRGHLGYNLVNYLPQPLHTMVMLRDPMERTVSHFEYICRDPGHPKYRQIHERKLGLKEYLLDKVLSAEVTNAQVRPLAHTADRRVLQELLGRSQSQQEFAKAWRHTPGVLPADDELLDVALQRLRQMAFVGVAEQLERGLQLAGWLLDANPPENISSLNINHQRTRLDEIPEETLQILKQVTALDSALYERGKALFEQQYRTVRDQSREQHVQEQMVNVADTGKTQKNAVLEVNFLQPLRGSGWHQRELVPGKGILRWTGAENEASIDVALMPDQRYELKIHIADWVSEAVLHSLELTLDSEPLLVEVLEEQGELFYVAEIPAKLSGEQLQNHSLQLKFSHSQMQKADSAEGIDHNLARHIGVAIYRFVFSPT
jgi:hypothetical protein